MADINYLSPPELSRMYDLPFAGNESPSAAGAHTGPLQGWLEGQAANQANQFINMNMQAQGNELAKQTLSNQEFGQLSGNRMSLADANLSQKQAESKSAQYQASEEGVKYGGMKADQQTRKLNDMSNIGDQVNAVASQGPIAQAAAYDSGLQNYKRIWGEDSVDPSMATYDPAKTPQILQQAKQMSLNSADFRQKSALQTQELTSKEKIASEAQAGETARGNLKNETEKQVAMLHAQAQVDVANINMNKTKTALQKETIDVLGRVKENIANGTDPQQGFTARDRGLLEAAPLTLNDSIYSNNAKGLADLDKIMGLVHGMENPNAPRPQPTQTPIGQNPRLPPLQQPQQAPSQPQTGGQGVPPVAPGTVGSQKMEIGTQSNPFPENTPENQVPIGGAQIYTDPKTGQKKIRWRTK